MPKRIFVLFNINRIPAKKEIIASDTYRLECNLCLSSHVKCLFSHSTGEINNIREDNKIKIIA